MEGGGNLCHDPDESFLQYLQSWGLREFHDEASYYEWQHDTLSQQDLQQLHAFVEQRQGGEDNEADSQFYDFLAQPRILSVLYSQRFDYFLNIASLISLKLSSAEHVLDFGCGVGILTCWFAQQHPETQFVGIDRSGRSIDVAREAAKTRHILNIQFHVIQGTNISLVGSYDCILSTQVLLQSEREPGLPSRTWRTFERKSDDVQQKIVEVRTGLALRLKALLNVLTPAGRLLCFEKTWNLGRRIFFQRALKARKLFLTCEPIPCSYHELGVTKIDGPLYEVSPVRPSQPVAWNEDPYRADGESLYRCVGTMAERMASELRVGQTQEQVDGQHATLGTWTVRIGVWKQALVWGWVETASGFRGLMMGSEQDMPLFLQLIENVRHLSGLAFEQFLDACWDNWREGTKDESHPGYENHHPSAQGIYESLPRKVIQRESTFTDGEGKEMHIEVGATEKIQYFYWANTFDQRQIVLMDAKGADVLHAYYQESLEEARRPSQ